MPPITVADLDAIKQELGANALEGQVDCIPVEVKQGVQDLILRGYETDCQYAHDLEVE